MKNLNRISQKLLVEAKKPLWVRRVEDLGISYPDYQKAAQEYNKAKIQLAYVKAWKSFALTGTRDSQREKTAQFLKFKFGDGVLKDVVQNVPKYIKKFDEMAQKES